MTSLYTQIRAYLKEPAGKAAAVALLIVVAFKIWMIVQMPLPSFTSDSHTYLRTARMFWYEHGAISIHPKRAFLYPVLLTLLHPLPGGITLPVLILQHLLTLLVPLACAALLMRWYPVPAVRWLAAPLILLCGLNVPLLFFSHYMIADAIYTVVFWGYLFAVWRFLEEPQARRAAWLFALAALCLSLRPDAKILVLSTATLSGGGLLLELARNKERLLQTSLPWAKSCAVPLLICAGLWLGTRVTQQGWLLYSSTLPLTQLEGGKYPEIKNELRPLVCAARSNLWDYPALQNDLQLRLSHPKAPSVGPRWDAMRAKGQNSALHNICHDLAVEGIRADPLGFVELTLAKLRYTLQKDRERHIEFRPAMMGSDYREQLKEEPGYIPILFGTEENWQKAQAFLPVEGPETLTPFCRDLGAVEAVTSPMWWSLWGALALAGWLLALRRLGLRMLLWFGLVAAYVLITYSITRGILRYLLPAEPMFALGLALLVAELLAVVTWVRGRFAAAKS